MYISVLYRTEIFFKIFLKKTIDKNKIISYNNANDNHYQEGRR